MRLKVEDYITKIRSRVLLCDLRKEDLFILAEYDTIVRESREKNHLVFV